MKARILFPALAAATLAACAPPKTLRGEFAEISPQQAQTVVSGTQDPIRWGGMILSMENSATQSCFEVLSRPLNVNARPIAGDQEQGRFLACYAGYKDPKVFEPGREITVVGRLNGTEPRKVGEYDYQYPKVAASEVYLWAERSDVQYAYLYDPFPYPYYGPYTYYYYQQSYYRPAPTPQAQPQSSGTGSSLGSSAPSASVPSLGTPLGGLRNGLGL